jgi:hypothetical protein
MLASTIFAYLDPGSGSILLYVLAGIFVAATFWLKRIGYWIWHRMTFWRHRTSFAGDLHARVILHVEAPRYEPLFKPIVDELAKRDIDYLLVTQYKRSASSTPVADSNKHIELGMSRGDFEVLNRAKADFFLTTTPQLDVLMLKRSSRVKSYGHVWHSANDIGSYEIFSLDYFDVLFCAGEYTFEGIRHIEKLRGFPPKKLYNTGVVYYDTMCQQARQTSDTSNDQSHPSKKPRVLIAPSWGPKSLFACQGVDFLDDLAAKYTVTVRPHPQIRLSQETLFQQIIEKCEGLGISIDTAPSGLEAMRNCDVLVSDFSGMTFDFAYVFEKSLVVFDMESNFEGLEGYWLEKPLWQLRIMSELAEVLSVRQIKQLPEAIDRALKRPCEAIAKIRDHYIPNFGHAAKALVDQTQEVLDEITSSPGNRDNA